MNVKLPVAEVHCAGCWLYDHKGHIAERITDLLEDMHCESHASRWDLQTCLQGCWKKIDRKIDYDRVKAREYYHQRNPNAKWRGV